MLDVGGGTGYCTRPLACDTDAAVVGVDANHAWLAYTRNHRLRHDLFAAGTVGTSLTASTSPARAQS